MLRRFEGIGEVAQRALGGIIMFEEKLEKFCFDVLGDFMDAKAYEIERDRRGDWRVIVLYPGMVHAPNEIIHEEWRKQAKGTEFEKVPLIISL